MSSTNIIQRNNQRTSQKKQELVDIVDKENPAILCIQETMLTKQTNVSIKDYNGLSKEGHITRRPHGGVEIFIHSNIPFKEITIKIPL